MFSFGCMLFILCPLPLLLSAAGAAACKLETKQAHLLHASHLFTFFFIRHNQALQEVHAPVVTCLSFFFDLIDFFYQPIYRRFPLFFLGGWRLCYIRLCYFSTCILQVSSLHWCPAVREEKKLIRADIAAGVVYTYKKNVKGLNSRRCFAQFQTSVCVLTAELLELGPVVFEKKKNQVHVSMRLVKSAGRCPGLRHMRAPYKRPVREAGYHRFQYVQIRSTLGEM